MNRRRAAALAAVVVVLAAAVVAWRGAARTPLQSATRMLPADTLRGSWTDWAGVRREVGATLDSSSSGEEVQAFLDRAFEAELTGSSALPGSAVTMQEEMGFSPATAEWELFAQSRAGAAVLLRLQSLDGVGERLRDLGYTEPAEETGVWRGGPDLLASIDGTLTPELQYVALVESENLVVTSDTEGYLATAVDAVLGDGDRLEPPDVLDEAGSPLSATLFMGDFACEALAMSQADAEDQAVAESLVAEAGGISPLTGLLVERRSGDAARVVMEFEHNDQARADAVSRARLARGPAAGQGGDYRDRFTLTSAASVGNLVVLDLQTRPDSYVLSDLTTGPVLLATC